MPFKLSPSTLSLFSECPRCFWLAFRKDVKRPAGIFPSLPSGMDSVLKQHFDSYMEKGELPPELKGIDDGTISLFDDAEKLKVWRSNFKGIQWKDENGNILKGAIDNLLKKGEKLIVLDFKTRGFPLKEDTAGHYQNQLNLYNLLFRKNGYRTEDYAYLLFYHPTAVNKSGEVIFKTDLVRMEIDTAAAEELFNSALRVLESDEVPSPGDECEYCKWLRTCGI